MTDRKNADTTTGRQMRITKKRGLFPRKRGAGQCIMKSFTINERITNDQYRRVGEVSGRRSVDHHIIYYRLAACSWNDKTSEENINDKCEMHILAECIIKVYVGADGRLVDEYVKHFVYNNEHIIMAGFQIKSELQLFCLFHIVKRRGTRT